MAKITNLRNLSYSSGLSEICSVTWNNKIYLFGGVDSFTCRNYIYVYDPVTNTYTDTGFTLPVPLRSLCGCGCGDFIYLFGGYDNNNDPNYKIYSFDLVNGVVDTTQVTTITPNFTWVVPNDGIYLLEKSSTYEVANLNTDDEITSVSTYVDGDSKLGNIYNLCNNDYYMSFKSGVLYFYEFEDAVIGDLVKSITINNNITYIESIIEYAQDKYLILGKGHWTAPTWIIYKCDIYLDTIVPQYNMESTLNTYRYFGLTWGITYNQLMMFGGEIGNPHVVTNLSYNINFDYYEISINYNTTYISNSNDATEIQDGLRYTTRLKEISVNGARTLINISHVYLGATDIKDQYGVLIGVPQDVSVVIERVTNDIRIETSYTRDYEVNVIKSDGVSFTGSYRWVQNTNYTGTFSIRTGYELTFLTITDYLGNDIKNTVYDDATKTITIPSGSWHTYRNIYIKAFAENPIVSITLYQNTSNDKTVQKSLTAIKKVTGIIKDECNITNPSILIDVSGEGNYTLQSNYVYIDQLQRYYYIRSIDFVRKNLWRLNLHVDVLMTYKDKIHNLTCYIKRNAETYNDMIPDGEMILSPEPIIQVEEIPNDVMELKSSTESILITTIWGV